MAAAIVPIVASVLPAAIPLIVKLIDKIFPPKSGPSKADAAAEIVAAIQQGLQNAKALQGAPLTGDQIRTAIETTVAQLNSTGALKGAATAIEPVAANPATSNLGELLVYLGRAIGGAK